MILPLVEGRKCGPCNVCCVLPPIVDPELKKAPGVVCHNWQAGGGCRIYATRSQSCRGHYCGWRHLPQLDDSWRPDACNIYIELKDDPPEHFRHVLPDAPYAFRFTMLTELPSEWLGKLATVAASLIAADVPVILALAPPPEHLGSHILLNPPLKPHAAAFGMPFLEGFVKALQTLAITPPEKAPPL